MIENGSAARNSACKALCVFRLAFGFSLCILFLSMTFRCPAISQSTTINLKENGLSSKTDSLKALRGQVKASELAVESSLKELGDTLHHLKDSAWSLFCEVQQPDQVFCGGPDAVGPIILTPVNGTGIIDTGALLPPRKKWVDYFVSQMDYLVPHLQQECQALSLPENISSDLSDEFNSLKSISSTLGDKLAKVKEVCVGPKYENMAIATVSQSLLDDLKTMERLRKSIYKHAKSEFSRLR